MKTLLTGKPYVKSELTDLKKTFARIRKEMKQAEDKRMDRVFRLPVAKKA